MSRPAPSLWTRRWLAAHVVALALLVLFLSLGFWQLRRLDERRIDNAVAAARMAEPALDLAEAVAAAGSDIETLTHRHVTARGSFDPDGEVLIRSQVENGQAGFHVITPFTLDSGDLLLVNRGWVPLEMGTVPVLASPESGDIAISGILAADQGRPGSSSGERPIYTRVDVEAIGGGGAIPLYLILGGDRGGRLPIPLQLPDHDSEGNHLSYAIQWFSFSLIGVIGYLLLLRRARQSGDNFSLGERGQGRRRDPDLGGA